MSEHVLPRRVYYMVFATLLLLTLITVEVAFYDFGWLTFQVALLIASTKALLVILYFMHVKYSGGLTGIFVASGFIFLAIMMAFMFADLKSRPWQYQPDDSGFSQGLNQ